MILHGMLNLFCKFYSYTIGYSNFQLILEMLLCMTWKIEYLNGNHVFIYKYCKILRTQLNIYPFICNSTVIYQGSSETG